MSWTKAKRLLVGLAFAGIPLITTASCDPYRGTLAIYRNDDYYDRGFFDVIIDDWFYDDCYFWDDCYYYDDYYYEEIVIWD